MSRTATRERDDRSDRSNRAERVVLAVDVGAATVRGSLVTDDGRVLRAARIATPVVHGPEAVVAAIRSFSRRLAARAPVPLAAAGLTVPGVVDSDAGVALRAANIGWRDVALRALLREELGVPVVLEHDARAAAEAEATIGWAAGRPDCTVVLVGSGVASVSLTDGRADRGATAHAGELGHLPVRPGGEPCGCGGYGCLEAYASVTAVTGRYALAAGRPRSVEQIVAARSVDPIAAHVWQEAIDALTTGLLAVTLLRDPALLVVGGALADAGDPLAATLRCALADALSWRTPPPVEVSRLGARASGIGAAAAAWRAVGVTRFDHWRVEPETAAVA
jgi:glucokinase